MVTINRNYVGAGIAALAVVVAGFLLKDNIKSWYNQRFSGETSSSEQEGTPLPPDKKSLFDQYQESFYFPTLLTIPKGQPKNVGTLVDKCVADAGVYYGSMGGLPNEFPKQEVAVACSAYLLEELAKAGCSPKGKQGAIYCNGKPVNKSSTFEVVVDKSLENNVDYSIKSIIEIK